MYAVIAGRLAQLSPETRELAGLAATVGAPVVVDTLSEAQKLNQRLGNPPDPLLLRALAIAALNVRNFQQGLAFGDQLLELADQQGDPPLLVEGHYVLGVTLHYAGSFTRSRVHLEQALARYDPAQLLLKQGKSTESRQLLTQAYGWFTEGLETPDLKNAQALLEN